ncbi:MAG: M14 family zinc carboxypeptidase [Planctomycetota bacterium]
MRHLALKHLWTLPAALLCLAAGSAGQEPRPVPVGAPRHHALPTTRAERTDYRETSRHADVIEFLEALQRAGAPLRITSLGVSTRGRDIPLVIAADPPVASPAAARRSGRAIVYIQANIHGGEVEGKEASLMLLRDLAAGDARPLLDRLILLVAPIYNADGNEDWGPGDRHRPGQEGPAVVGRRSNGMGLDLNRDCMKAESPEMRGALRRIYTTWDPDVILDLHTTNGTRHGYALTYSPPLTPDCEPGVLSFTRDELLPAVRRRLREHHGMETFDYGNRSAREGEEEGWFTFSPLPRYVTNYAGLRNRIGILSEATSYRPFRDRVLATRRFVREVLEQVAGGAPRIIALTRAADEKVTAWGLDAAGAPSLGVRFEPASRGVEPILIEEVAAGDGKGKDGRSPAGGAPGDLSPSIREVPMRVFDRFRPTRTARLPAAYLIPPSFPEAARLLRSHGVLVEALEEAWQGGVEVFTVEELRSSPRAFQGHRLTTLEGSFARRTEEFPPRTLVVPTGQPLGLLAFHLLEPESADGLAAWGFLDRGLRKGRSFPIRKALVRVDAPRRALR